MIRTTRMVTEVKCKNCGIVQLRGERFNGQRCCEHSHPSIILGERMIVEYEKTIEEDRQEMLDQFNRP